MTPEQLVAWLRDEDDGMKTPCLEAADLIESLSSKLDEVSKELAATKGGPISCEAHGWSGDDNCAYCRAEDAEGRLDILATYLSDHHGLDADDLVAMYQARGVERQVTE